MSELTPRLRTLLDNRCASAIFAGFPFTRSSAFSKSANPRVSRVSSFALFRKFTVAVGLATLTMGTMGGWTGPAAAAPIPVLPSGQLSVTDVQTIIAQAVTQAVHDKVVVVIAVTDREGNVLGVFDMNGTSTTPAPTVSLDDQLLIFSLTGNPAPQQIAIQKARTASYLSSDQNAFSTRTAENITMKHFPLGIDNAGPGPLFGLPMSSLPCGDVQKNGSGLSGKYGGIPLYINGAIAGGIGIDGAHTKAKTPAENQNEDEVIALAGTRGIYHVPVGITANNILVNGFRFPWIGSRLPNNLTMIPFASLDGALDANFPAVCGAPPPAAPVICATPPLPFTETTEAGVPGEWRVPPTDSMVSNLTAADVIKMVDQSLTQAKNTRAAIRVPVGVPARMQVGVTDTGGNVIGLFRTNDATMFSEDIVIQKCRTVVAFSDPNNVNFGQLLRKRLGLSLSRPLAVTSRTIEFLAQPFYPPGITGTTPGPMFCDTFGTILPSPPAPKTGENATKVLPFCLQMELFFQQPNAPCLPSLNGLVGDGITLFPGSTPLYKSGVLVGGLGLSGDGVDQDDFITNSGGAGYLPPNGIRATTIQFRGAYLPFFKFPRHPDLD
jgi:uncharacterized protein GlcG (DUF336 family)